MKDSKKILIVIILTVLVYLLMVLSLYTVHNIERNIAVGYIERTCELVGDTEGKWYACTK